MAEKDNMPIAFNREQLKASAFGNGCILEVIEDTIREISIRREEKELEAKLRSEVDADRKGDAAVTQADLIAVKIWMRMSKDTIDKKKDPRNPKAMTYKQAQTIIEDIMGEACKDESTLREVYEELKNV